MRLFYDLASVRLPLTSTCLLADGCISRAAIAVLRPGLSFGCYGVARAEPTPLSLGRLSVVLAFGVFVVEQESTML